MGEGVGWMGSLGFIDANYYFSNGNPNFYGRSYDANRSSKGILKFELKKKILS